MENIRWKFLKENILSLIIDEFSDNKKKIYFSQVLYKQ